MDHIGFVINRLKEDIFVPQNDAPWERGCSEKEQKFKCKKTRKWYHYSISLGHDFFFMLSG